MSDKILRAICNAGIANYLEDIGSVIVKDPLAIVGKRIRKKLTISESPGQFSDRNRNHRSLQSLQYFNT